MRLTALLKSSGIPQGLADPEITSLCYDSRKAEKGCLFFALPGKNQDGAAFAAQAAEKGAVAIVAEKSLPQSDCPLVIVSNARQAIADIASAFYSHPSLSLKAVGITGTNGKTTTAFLVKHLLDAAFMRCGLVGTVKYMVGDNEVPAPHTTPESIDLQSLMGSMVDNGSRAVAMEVSSHALVQERVRAIEFDAAVFTNLTQDHLDYHGSMDAYYEAKALLFESLAHQKNKKARAIINADDRFGQKLVDQFSKKIKILTIGRGVHADYRATSIRYDLNGTTFTLEARGKSYLVRLPLIGLFNVYNAMGAIAAANACGVDLRNSIAALASAPQVPGRLERVPAKRHFQVFVDYAHTDDALRNVLRTLQELKPSRLITVFGCGGDRDRAKRPLMAAAAEELSDWVIMTSDNPRSENPDSILKEMQTGLRGKSHEIIPDRASAIHHAIQLAEAGDIVLIAGKGHEKYQEFSDRKVAFDDVAIATRAISEKRGGTQEMDKISLSQIAEMAGAKILQGSPEMLVSLVSKDSRTITPGDLYIALRGENFDGNAYASDALARGAAAVLLDSAEAAHSISSQHPVLLVENGLAALTRLAAAWRSKLKLKVVGITGSSGKTSTKDFTAAVLGSRLKVVKTAGNLNNHIGVPLSILAASSGDEVAVWEVGMNHPGEIAPLAALIKPDCVIITNIGVAHIEHMKTREAIALEKGMLAESVNPSGAVILVSEDDKTESIAQRSPAKVIRVGFTKGDLVAESLESDEKGTAFTIIHQGKKYEASIPVHGAHMVQNALLAIAAGLELGIPFSSAIKALSRAKLTDGRLEQKTRRGVLYLDDTYNANPDSMEAALHTLRQINGQGRRIAVLGKMGELGDYAAEGYQRTGTAAGKFADILITVGKEASAIATSARKAGLGRIHEVEETSAAARMLEQLARPGDIVLVKGSRSARMETLFQHIPN